MPEILAANLVTGIADDDRLRNAIEATRLKYGTTATDILGLANTTRQLGVRGVCVPIRFLADLAQTATAVPVEVDVVTVVNFPTGDRPLEIVSAEIDLAVDWGATHIDVVVPGGLIAQRDWRGVVSFLRRVRDRADEQAIQPIAIKAILETAAFDEDHIRGAAKAAIEAGIDWLKTSTGFHPAGGATEAIVSLLREIAPEGVGIKASGGIRTRASALAMLDAGADRIGTSSEATILGAR